MSNFLVNREHLLSPEFPLQINYSHSHNSSTEADNGEDVIFGLTKPQKFLPPRYLYDDKGSQLFEKICELPEYYPTRTEAGILQVQALEIAKITGQCELVELGSGSSTKTRWLLDAYQELGHFLHYVPIDVSAGILKDSSQQLLSDYPNLQIKGWVGTYQQTLSQLHQNPVEKRLVLFLGSTLGNFSQHQCDNFFAQINSVLETGDYFLLGIDLQKPREVLEAAYNDSQGVTADFNLNVLNHLNRLFSGNFDLYLFSHRAIYNQTDNQIEMHLHCRQSHLFALEKLDLNVKFNKGETILTEISRKFNLSQMQKYLQTRNLHPVKVYTDPKQWFGLILAQKN